MDPTVLAGHILTPAGWIAGSLRCTAQIGAIEPGPAPDGRFLVPGFVDLHVHGGDGADCMAGADAVRRMAHFHARHGTTSLLATTVTAPADALRAAAANPVDAAHLGIPPGSPVMATVRYGYLADGRPVEFTRSVYRGDRYDFVAEMRRG